MKLDNGLHSIIILTLQIVYLLDISTAGRPCAPRQIANRSVVCVCNATYCDELTRDVLIRGQYATYTTSAAGSRFKKGRGYFSSTSNSSSAQSKYFLELDVSKKYQTVIGFGGAVTDSAAINWKSLPKSLQKYLIDSYFSIRGIEYNMVRVPIGCSDFSVRHYTYDDHPGDVDLKKFSLQEEDYKYKIPMLKEIFKVATDTVHVIGSTWTPPHWMKYLTDDNPKCGYLKREYYQVFANYILKFIESYRKEGVTTWAVTPSNEPSLADFAYSPISCLGWSVPQMGSFIVDNLGPTLRKSKFSDVKLLALDDQLYLIKTFFDEMVRNNSKVLNYVDGVAVHYYSDCYIKANVLTHVTETYAKLFVISTEASAGFQGAVGVDLGSWENAQIYIYDIIRDLNHDEVGWIDWNLCLDKQGGPNVDKNYVDSPIVVDAKNKEFYKQPMFYALGHVSKFIPRGSVRIGAYSPPCSCVICNVAFLTPKGTIVVVIHNIGKATSVTIKVKGEQATIKIEADSITTVEFLYNSKKIKDLE